MSIRRLSVSETVFAKYRNLFVVFVVFVFILFNHSQVVGQAIALRGSYSSAVSDGVDVFSGKLEQVLPLTNVKGRGDTSVGLFLPLRNQDWQVVQTGITPTNDRNYYAYQATLGYFLIGGAVESQYPLASVVRGGYGYIGKIGARTSHGSINLMTMPAFTTITYTSNNGSIMEFRDTVTDGQPLDARARGCLLTTYSQTGPPPACSRGRVFRSTDGSNAIFVSDTDVYDEIRYDPNYAGVIDGIHGVSGTIFMSDGTLIIIENGLTDIDGNNVKVSKVIDRNGNFSTFEYSPSTGPGYSFLTKIIDSLKREVTLVYGDQTQSSYYDEIVYKGFAGTERRIRINYTGVENAMVTGESLTPIFPEVVGRCYMLAGGGPPCPGYPLGNGPGAAAQSQAVVSSVVLPNGKQYNFFYNRFLEVARIQNPLGSYMDYDYSNTRVGAASDGFMQPVYGDGGDINRRVATVKRFDESGQLVLERTFSNVQQQVLATNAILDNVIIESIIVQMERQ